MAKGRNTSHPPVTESEAQEQHTSETISIRNLWNDRSLYENYPKFQRQFVWPDKFKRALIDSILRGAPIHGFFIYKAIDDEGKEKYWILDGHQRLSTIYDFIAGQLTTWTIAQARYEEPNSLPPVESGKHFFEMSERAKNLFQAYKFTINFIEYADEAQLGMYFRRIQHQLPLKPGEKLASYKSKATDFAFKLQEHPIWETDFYVGPETRKEPFQGSLSLIVLELMQGYTDLSVRRLNQVASGMKDDKMTQELYDAIIARLGVVTHVFDGVTFNHRAEIIPMYQAVQLLEERGHTFATSDRGCLAPWFGKVISEANQTSKRGFAYPIAQLVEVNAQYDFWDEHLPTLLDLCKNAA